MDKKRPRRKFRGLILLSVLILEGSSLSLHGIQDLFPDAEGLRSNLQKLVAVDELQALLQAHDLGRSQFQGLVRTGRTGVGQMLGLAYITSISSVLPFCPMTIPEYTFSPAPMKRVPRS